MLHDPVLEKERPNTGKKHWRALCYLDVLEGSHCIHSHPLFFPQQNKEAFVAAAKDVITNCQSVTHFIRVIANHCRDKQCTVELSLIVEQILTITNQLNIISRSEDEP